MQGGRIVGCQTWFSFFVSLFLRRWRRELFLTLAWLLSNHSWVYNFCGDENQALACLEGKKYEQEFLFKMKRQLILLLLVIHAIAGEIINYLLFEFWFSNFRLAFYSTLTDFHISRYHAGCVGFDPSISCQNPLISLYLGDDVIMWEIFLLFLLYEAKLHILY